MNRREFVSGMAALGSAAVLDGIPHAQTAPAFSADLSLPRKADFAIPEGETYINSAYVHPMPLAGREALRRYAESRTSPVLDTHYDREHAKAKFAALINAKPSEISYVPNTSTGENLVVNGLGLEKAGSDSNVVTDALHFDSALLHLGELKRRSGLDLRIVMPRDWRIDLKDLERVIDRKTKLVEISLVAMANGFQHDLKSVCDLAHAHGAYVYADIIQAAGNTPIDVRASGVDFCSCSSFKWLMGDFGLGFLYCREELLGKIRRPQIVDHPASRMDTHFLPFDAPADTPFTWELGSDASAHFESGSNAFGPMSALGFSLPYVREIGV